MSERTENILRWLGFFARVAIGALFIFSGTVKILAPLEEFQAIIKSYEFLPLWAIQPFSIALPIIEVVAGISMVLGLFERQAAIIVALMVASFLIAITVGLVRGVNLSDCGCFGSFKFGDTPQQVLFRDWILIALTIFIAIHPPKKLALDNVL